MEYLVKISKKTCIRELKRRYLKINVLTSNTSYPSRKIRRICAYISLKTTKDQGSRINTPYPEESIRRIQVMIVILVGPAGDPWDQRVRSQLISKDLVSGLLVYELPLSNELANMANSHNAEINASAKKPSLSDPLGHLHKDLNSLTSRVEHLESSLAQQVADKIEDYVPRLVADAFEERVPKLLSNTLKNILPQIIKDSVKQALPKFDKGVKKTLNAKIHELLIKPLYNAFNLLNKKERNRVLVILIDSLSASAKAAPEKEKMSTQDNKNSENKDLDTTDPAPAQGEQSSKQGSEEKPIEDEPSFNKLRFLVPNPNIPSLNPLKSIMPQGIRPPIVINMPLDQFTDNIFNTTTSEFSLSPLKDDKGKGVASEEDPLKELIPLIDEGGSTPKFLNL
ncbi:hypothetical protein Tco_1491837 [Tanacetum coccineum]